MIFDNLDESQSISKLWEKVKNDKSVYNYERFILSLDMLFLLDLVDFKEDKLVKVKK